MPTRKCVHDYDQLRNVALPPRPPGIHHHTCDYLFVSGLPAPENGGLQGFFEWRSHSPEDDDSGTVIKPNAVSAQKTGETLSWL
jgi:hypothetical protein